MKGLALDAAFFDRMAASQESAREYDQKVKPIVDRARAAHRTNRDRYYALLDERDAAYDAGDDETARLIARAMAAFS